MSNIGNDSSALTAKVRSLILKNHRARKTKIFNRRLSAWKICVSRILSRDARNWGFVAWKSNVSFVHNSHPPKAYFINWSQLGHSRPDFSTLPNFCTAKKEVSAWVRCFSISIYFKSNRMPNLGSFGCFPQQKNVSTTPTHLAIFFSSCARQLWSKVFRPGLDFLFESSELWL